MYAPTDKDETKKKEITKKSTIQKKKTGQKQIGSSSPIRQFSELQKVADQYANNLGFGHDRVRRKNEAPKQFKTVNASSQTDSSIQDGVVQRAINVFLKTDTDSKKKLVAEGKVKDFQGGSSAQDRGWLGVTKYRSRYTIEDDDDHEDSGESRTLQNEFTNPEAGHVLAKQNGGNGNDPENIFAQDGGTNNRDYRIFENQMRRDLNKYEDDDDVEFVSYLVGEDLELGSISDYGLDSASDISSDEDDSMSI